MNKEVMNKAKRYNPPKIEPERIKKGFLLYLFLIPLFISTIIALFNMKLVPFLLDSVAFMLFYGVVYLSKRGFVQEMHYENSRIAKAPKIHYKEFAAYLLGLATFYSAYIAGDRQLFEALFISVIAVLGYWLYYGFDPRRDKLEDFGDISAKVVLETLHEAQEKIGTIEKDIGKIDDKEVYDKIYAALAEAKTVMGAIEEEPEIIRSARKFLIVYIDGVAKVTSSYTALAGEIDDPTRERLLQLMEDVESRFQKELQRLKANDQFDLDVHIDVLKEQIKH